MKENKKMEMDLISVVIPVYNVEKFLARCLDSVISQTYKNLEIILIDDGSTDSSGIICNKYLKIDNRIKVVHKKNEGLGYARNTGLDIATGRYVVFIDSDDYIENKMIEILYNDLKRNKADTCIGGFKRIIGDETIVNQNPLAGQLYESNRIMKEVLSRMFGPDYLDDIKIEMSVWKVLFSNEIIQKNKIRFLSEREYISEDIIFDTEYYPLSRRVYMSSNCGYLYCDNENSLTNTYREDRFDKQVVLNNELRRRAKLLGISDSVRKRLDNLLVSLARYSIKLEVAFSNINGKKKARSNIQRICNNSELSCILSEYDQEGVRNFSKIVNWMIRKKHISLLYVIMYLKNKLRI